MANHVNIKEIAELIDEEPFDMNWFSYDLGGGWGSRLTKYNKKGAAQGIITPGFGSEVSISRVYKKLKTNDFRGVAGFYVGILAFFGEKIYENLDFVEKIPKNSVNTLVSSLKCPEKYKEKVYEICHSEYDFLDFISAASKLEKTHFDEDSAISVYKLQGNRAIYPLLCQMFYVNKGIDELSPCLIPDLPVDFQIDISDFVSGCHFPVAVSPMISGLKWNETPNGWFLYGKIGENWLVLDVVGVGRMNLSNYALTNRLNYLGGGGQCVPYLICWNWGDIISAYRYFDQNLLIRDLKNTIFDQYWFIFGPKSKINVSCRDGYINGNNEFGIVHHFDTDIITSKTSYVTINLQGDFVRHCDKSDIIYSKSEIFDWIDIFNQCK